MYATDIKTRRYKILEAIVNAYIDNASPVGSRTICQKFRFGVSPATIRNDMAELELEGLVYHLHTSSGRVPTERGFRYYVNSIMGSERLSPAEKEKIRLEYESCRPGMEGTLEHTSHILSKLTDNVGMVLLPQLNEDCFKHIEIVSIGSKRILSVLITSRGLSKGSVIELRDEIVPNQLINISRFLNSELKGVRLNEIEERLVVRLLNESDSFYHLLKIAIEVVHKNLYDKDQNRMYLEGRENIIKQPEFRNTQKAVIFLRILEEKTELIKVLKADMESDEVCVHIGEEDLSEGMMDFSIVSKCYKICNKIAGSVGVLGPVRMEYTKAITTVDYIADIISDLLGRP